MKWIKRSLAVITLLYIAICLWIYFFQEKLLFHPPVLASDFKYSFKDKFREFNIDMGSGTVVNALQFYTEKPAKGVVVYFHGNGEALDYTGTKAYQFTSRGYDCMMVDYPTYGKSTGTLSQDMLFRVGDSLMYCAREQQSPGRIILYGRSLGTGIAAHTARQAEWFKALILEAPYYSMNEMAARRYPWLPVSLLTRYPISTNLYLKNLNHPIYAIHGTNDEVIPIESPRKLLKYSIPNFSLTEVPGAGHGNLANYKEYDQLLDKVLK